MTQHDTRLLERLREESRDAMDYTHMAEQAREAGNEWLSDKLREIAYEEYTHAYTIRRALMMSDAAIDPETCRMFREAKEAVGA